MCFGGARERKKIKAHELEHTVAALSDQLDKLAEVKSANADLQDRNMALISRLRSKEEEIERMQQEKVIVPAPHTITSLLLSRPQRLRLLVA